MGGQKESGEDCPSTKHPMRYGHTEGHTDVCFDDKGSYIVTCGSDGDVRIWENLDDDDPKTISVGEKAYSFALKNGKLVTAVSNNTVQIHTFPEGVPDGILTRFTTNANHVTFNADGTQIAAGSSDFIVKIVQVDDSSQQKTLRGHEAPVLSLAFDPKDVFLASASCDGSVRVWKIADQACEMSRALLQKCSDVVNAKSICRLAWQPKIGKLLAVPVEKSVQLYERDSWRSQIILSDDFLTQILNVVTWSPCGQYLAAGSIDGCIVIWDVTTKECIERVKHDRGYTVCGLAWHPSRAQIAYTDNEGNLGLLENVCDGRGKKSTGKVQTTAAKDYDGLFDDDDDENDFLNREPVEFQEERPHEDDDDDDLMPISGRLKHRGSILDDDNSLEVPSLKPGIDPAKNEVEDNYDDRTSSVQAFPAAALQRPIYDGPKPTPRQKPFQSGSTPSHLMHRFMAWNSVGVVRCYNDEQDNAVDVEFHDTSVHHAMHLTNTLNHTMADLSQEAVLLACESTDELASKLQCLHFSSWDTNKEWTVDMPKDEDIQALCLGQGWVACATSSLLLRVFTVGGVQKEIISLPGPVVSLAAHGDQLMIVFHRAVGFDEEQCLGVQLMELGKRKRQTLRGDPLPLTRKSYLTWVGFSAEGTPCYMDSEGIVRMLNRALCNTWTPVCNTREHCKGKSDHYWIVGIHENPQQLRCIPCKGARFPPTLPRPTVAILPFKLPYCQISTEKGQMEEQFWRSVVFSSHLDYLSKNEYEYDENYKNQMTKEQQELLMKMFALSCKLEREFRCIELTELMTQNVMNLAIKYAFRSKRLTLAQRLGDLALEKAAEMASLQQQQEEDEEEEDFRTRMNAGYSRTATEWNQPQAGNIQSDQDSKTNSDADAIEGDEMESEEMRTMQKQRLNPLSKSASSPETPSIRSGAIISSSQGRVNPFKVSADQTGLVIKGSSSHTANILDNMNKFTKKTATPNNQATSKQKTLIIKPLIPKTKSKLTQGTLFHSATPKAEIKKTEKKEREPENTLPEISISSENTENKKPKTGFQLWMDENRNDILAANPDLEESDVIKEGMNRFRVLLPEERMLWTERAKGGGGAAGDSADVKKRKRATEERKNGRESQTGEVEEGSCTIKKRKPLDPSTNTKLSAFAFKKD
ncbi:WD repeat and HMG-box DNA-binding protein 1 [Rhinatrema bivittatum]|uniref:WD repeat and HMG-box DNA-binding protein 1 n=1 Tax=Rhinatrema bivittatum TaxID=194408 RepID=UPI00112D197A|nr:WD repeat and HMG-box DNA-binding protein 1 [Rhinatrema bivittatum]